MLIAGATYLMALGISKPAGEIEQRLSQLSTDQQRRTISALEDILQFNWEGEVELGKAVMRVGSYGENSMGGIYQAVFVVDIEEIGQSYRINYYYLTLEQEKLFNYTTLASCLPVEDLIYGDFDCKGDRQTVFIDKWQETASALSVKFGIPWEAVVAQGVLESASGTSKYAVERNNFFGIGAFDHNPDLAISFATPEAGWAGYFENIVRTRVYCQEGAFRGENITDPFAYLRTVKSAGYATDPEYINSISPIVEVIVARAEKKGWASSAELAERYPEMRTNASKNTCY